MSAPPRSSADPDCLSAQIHLIGVTWLMIGFESSAPPNEAALCAAAAHWAVTFSDRGAASGQFLVTASGQIPMTVNKTANGTCNWGPL